MEDEVMEEFRKIKDDIAAEHNHDVWALYAYFNSVELPPGARRYSASPARIVARESFEDKGTEPSGTSA